MTSLFAMGSTKLAGSSAEAFGHLYTQAIVKSASSAYKHLHAQKANNRNSIPQSNVGPATKEESETKQPRMWDQTKITSIRLTGAQENAKQISG